MLLDLKKIKEKYDLNIKGVIHIGAHFGQEFKVYDELGIKNVLFFEPLPNIGANTLINITLSEFVMK